MRTMYLLVGVPCLAGMRENSHLTMYSLLLASQSNAVPS